MKRNQDSMASSLNEGETPAHKKQKVSPMVSQGVSVADSGNAGGEESGWTKVEKRTMKKQKKLNARQEVRNLFVVSSSSPSH